MSVVNCASDCLVVTTKKAMVNPEEVLQSLDEFSKLKPKDIPRELEEYLLYVAKTGDPVYQWSLVKFLFREKMLNVITEFYESCPSIDLPPCPNVDPFNYETMKANLLERLESFSNAPFTVQRLCELLTTPRKEYTRVDKFMRAIEKNILVVSTKEPGGSRARGDSTPQQTPQSQSDVLMNGVMDGRGTGGLDIGEAIETVSADGVNLMHAGEAVTETTEVALADSIRVDCGDIIMEEDDSVTWHSKAGECRVSTTEGLKSMSNTPDPIASSPSTTVVWDTKVEECGVNGEGIKTIALSADTVSTVSVEWETKASECEGDGLKDLTVASESVETSVSASVDISPPASSTKPSEDEHEATAVAVVSEFLTPHREAFGQPVELGSGVEGVPLVLATGPEQEQVNAAVEVTASCSSEVTSPDNPTLTTTSEIQTVSLPVEQSSEVENKDAPEAKESDLEDTSQVDAESGISCSPDTSSDCATAEMNQTLETNGSLEITSVESEVMSPLEALEDVTANISPPSPDQCANLDTSENTPPPTFSELTTDEDTQDAVRSSDQLDDEPGEAEAEPKIEAGTKSETEPVAVAECETSMEVEETPMEVDTCEDLTTPEQTVDETPAIEQTDSNSETPAEDPLPYSVV